MEQRRVLTHEVLLVLALSLGASAIYSVVSIVSRLTAAAPLAQQTATLNPTLSPRPYLDLTLQLLNIFFDLMPALLAIHLLHRFAGDPPPELGLDRTRLGFDITSGVGLAALIGIPGLGLYLLARALGINAIVVPAALPGVWWSIPVLLLAAVQNAILEEVVVVGYLMTRLRQLGASAVMAVTASALLRGSYHLYQGFGAFLGNVVMGAIFSVFFLRTRRVLPLVIAHALIDVVAFVGYTLLGDRLDFLR